MKNIESFPSHETDANAPGKAMKKTLPPYMLGPKSKTVWSYNYETGDATYFDMAGNELIKLNLSSDQAHDLQRAMRKAEQVAMDLVIGKLSQLNAEVFLKSVLQSISTNEPALAHQ